MITSDWIDLPDMLDEVQDLLNMGLVDNAQEILDEHEASFKIYWEFHFLYSCVHTDRNRPRDAIPCLLQGLRIERDNADCLIGLFYAFSMMNRVKRGGCFLLRAEEIHPDNDMVLSALVWYYTEMNDLEKALKYFERAKAANSVNPETYRNGAIAFDRLGMYDEAEECYKAALAITPKSDDVRDFYADHLVNAGRVDDAVKLYDAALKDSPKNIRYTSKLIYCLSQKGDFDAASALASRSIETYPNSPVGYIDLAYIHLNTNNYDDAENCADLAMSVSPIDSEGYRVKAIACSERDQFDTAEEYFKKAAALSPDNPDIWRDYYQHLHIAGKDEEMLALIEKTIKTEYPYCTEDYWFLADYYREIGQLTKAFRYLRLAYDTMPSEKELLPPMIEILLERGHIKFSLPLFAEYVEKSGWTDAMSEFMTNKQFRDKSTQEGMRFLRFTGERPIKYRKYIFNLYLYKFGLIYYTITAAAFMFPASVLFGWRGAAGVAAVYAVSLTVMKIVQAVRFRMAVIRSARAAQQGGGYA